MDSVTFQNTFRTLSLENVKIHPEHYWKKGKNTVKTTSITRSTWAKSSTWETVPINQHICEKLWLYHNIENWIKWSFVYKDLRPVHPRMLCAKFCWDWSNLSWEDAFQILSMHFLLFQRLLKYCQFIFAISLSSLLGKWRGTSFEQTWIRFTQEWFVQSLVEISSVTMEEIFKFSQCIFAILILSPFRKVRNLHLNKLESLLPKDDSLMYFRFYVIISIWKRAEPFIWTNVNPLHPRMPCVKFGWNWLSGSREEDENVKLPQRRRRTNFDQESTLEPSAQVI